MNGKERLLIGAIKRPGKQWEHWLGANTLEALQAAVGGYIEVLPIGEDMALIVDEEGKLKEKAANFALRGDMLVGDVLAVGVQGEDFCHLPARVTVRELERLYECWPWEGGESNG